MPAGHKRSVRANQHAAKSRPGTHFKSPLKGHDKRKQQVVQGIGREQKLTAARERLDALLRREPISNALGAAPIAPIAPDDAVFGSDANMGDWTDMDEPPFPPSVPSPPPKPSESVAQRLNDAWNQLLPQLETPWLQYYERTHGKPRNIIPAVIQHECTASCETSTVSKVKCLYPTHIEYVTASTCGCKPVAVLLVEHGVFPAPAMRSALAAALHTLYERRGFRVLSEQKASEDEQVSDPYRRLLIQAVQWAMNLRDRVERQVAAVLGRAESLPSPALEATTEATMESMDPTSATAFVASAASPAPDALTEVTTEAVNPTSATAFVDPVMAFVPPPPLLPLKMWSLDLPPIVICPLLPMLRDHHRSNSLLPMLQGLRPPVGLCLSSPLPMLQDLRPPGGDVQFGADGCFSYRHLRKAGDGPISYDPSFFIPKHKVDAVGKRLEAAKKRPAAKVKPAMLQEVIDACQELWDAANEKKRKADPKRHNASGIFVMTCRHGQVIFLCNIDTPGEQQRYIIAMLEEVAGLLPSHATMLQAYDVGCVTDHSLNLHPIFPAALRERISFVINGMHAYGHHWACQLVYSPRFHPGIGLADHEGVERFWSRIHKLIPLTRGQWNSRRIWMIDQYAGFMSAEGRASLGSWIHRQQRKNVTPKHRAAMRMLQECQVPVQELRAEWEAQKAAQTSIRAHAPARLRCELGKVLLLQNQIDTVEKAINETKKTLHGSASPHSLGVLRSLETTHERLGMEAEQLYASLNIQTDFPELRSLPLEFAQTLLLMRDLKINIRKHAIGSFFEWESLDRAVSGRREALGTKLHQSTRKAISKRQPSLLKAIKNFNTGCETLERLRPSNCNIPIPSSLSTQLNSLRNDPSLHEDVWITPSDGPIPRWLNDEDVRDGIRSFHTADRCAKEVVRLNLERDNLRRWLMEEQEVVRRAIEMTPDSPITFLLRLQQVALVDLECSWAPCLRFQDVESRFVTESTTSATTFGTSATPFALSTAFATTIMPSSSSPTLPTRPVRHSTHPPPVTEEVDLFEEAEEAMVEVDTDEYELDPDEENETETSAVEASDCLDVKWDYTPCNADSSFIPDLATRNTSLQVLTGDLSHFVVRTGLRPLEITVRDMAPFLLPTGRLTGFGLNGVATSLHALFTSAFSPTKVSASQCAVFGTYDLPCVRYKGSDPDLWRRVAPTQYWEKPVWLIPIHRAVEEHWVLVVVVVPTRELFFFDSLASRGGWRQDLRDVMVLITRLVALSNRNQHPLHVSTEDPTERWVAHPLFTVGHPRQTNGYDCGLWVLCMMAAVMRGYRDVDLFEGEMPWVRGVLRDHVRTLPIA
ncbi:hypothetical protein B0H13DRAFT_2360391 [Mycena leptocephala]|nr:hypothetical protein B0H13DRAFT_2360391 [Mycena leptocephala]